MVNEKKRVLSKIFSYTNPIGASISYSELKSRRYYSCYETLHKHTKWLQSFRSPLSLFQKYQPTAQHWQYLFVLLILVLQTQCVNIDILLSLYLN